MNYAGTLKGGDDDVIKFLGDTGAQMHCMVSDPGTLWNEKKLNTSAKFGNDSKAKMMKKGDLNVITEMGMGMEFKEIHVIPGCGESIIQFDTASERSLGLLLLIRETILEELKGKGRNLHYLKIWIACDENMKIFATEAEMKKHATVTDDEEEEAR